MDLLVSHSKVAARYPAGAGFSGEIRINGVQLFGGSPWVNRGAFVWGFHGETMIKSHEVWDMKSGT